MQGIPPEIKDKYLTARKTIDKKADHIWCITATLSAIGSDEDESISLDAHTLKYWMKSISLTVGEIIEILDQLHGKDAQRLVEVRLVVVKFLITG